MSVQKRKYDSDFKRNAVKLSEEPGRNIQDVAGTSGLRRIFYTGGEGNSDPGMKGHSPDVEKRA